MQPDAIDQKALIECYRADPAMTHQKWVLWACDCAERVIGEYQARYPADTRPAQAIAAARRWVANPADAAADAAYAAANAAANAAKAAAHAAHAAANAAYAAAYAAHAAHAADAAAERLWQTVRLMEIYHEERP